jgi:hypothetical protein
MLTLIRTIYSGSDPLTARTTKFLIDFNECESSVEEIAWEVFEVYQRSVREAARRESDAGQSRPT